MDNSEIRSLIERLERTWLPGDDPHEAAKALSLLLDVKVAADDLLWCTANPPTMDMATAKLKQFLVAVEDA